MVSSDTKKTSLKTMNTLESGLRTMVLAFMVIFMHFSFAMILNAEAKHYRHFYSEMHTVFILVA